MQHHFRSIVLLILATALCVRLVFALAHPILTDDGGVYARIAGNWLEHGAYSSERSAPYAPNYFRLPGYPSLIAAVYALFGAGNDRALRIVQAIADTITCLLAALLARSGCTANASLPQRRRVFVTALGLAAACPFTIVYVGAILTETLAMLVWTAAFVLAARAFATHRACWFAAAGVACGVGALIRPDGVLVILALLVALGCRAWTELRSGTCAGLRRYSAHALLLVLGASAALTPWAIRNALAFGAFMPLAPKYENLRGEFVEVGYRAWLRTWIDDFRYVDPLEWRVGSGRIELDAIPERAFDSPAEKRRVAVLLARYARTLEITPQIDADFEALARERLARHPIRCTLVVGLRRALGLWFDTHSDYYPFAGPLWPWPRVPANQRLARLAFMALLWLYTVLGVVGVLRGWRDHDVRAWLMPLLLFVALRMMLLATLENPEPRYTIEFFPLFASIIALGCSAPVRHVVTRAARARAPRDLVLRA